MTSGDAGTLGLDGREHRLHPLSWLFVLIAQLKQFILPLLVLLFAGRGDRHDLWGLIAVAVLVAVSLAEYFTYRYRLQADAIVIRSGWLQRSLRDIPYARIHNVNLHQTLLHRLVGVAEVRLESAGGTKPEAQMRVLSLAQAHALEALIKRRGLGVESADVDGVVPPLLVLGDGELVRLGLISNRGMLVVAAGLGVMAQTGENVSSTLLERWGRLAFGQVVGLADAHAQDSPLVLGLAAASLAVLALLLLRLLSVVLALLQFHGFTLREEAGRVTVERGLLGRTRSSVKRGRIQAWTLQEGVLHRWFKRRSLRVDTASGQRGQEEGRQGFRDVAPIATPAQCDALIAHFLPQAGWETLAWQPLHMRAGWLMAWPGMVLALVAVIVVCSWHGPAGLWLLVVLPVLLWRGHRQAARCAYADNGQLVAWRRGWWRRSWHFARIDKLQAVRLSQSPLQRRFGMASLLLDTAGASPFGSPLQLHHLALPEAQALSLRLVSQMARGRLRW